MSSLDELGFPTFAMQVELIGGTGRVLDELVDALPPGRRILNQQVAGSESESKEMLFFWTEQVTGLTDKESRRATDILMSEITLINGVWRGIEGLNVRYALKPTGTRWLTGSAPGQAGAFIHMDSPLYDHPAIWPYRKLSNDGPRLDEVGMWLGLAGSSRRISEGLKIFSREPLDWIDLWKLFELGRAILTDSQDSSKLWSASPAYITQDNYWRFKVSANDPIISGELARHSEQQDESSEERARRRRAALINPMMLWEAKPWVLGFWRRVMWSVKQAPANFYLDGPPPQVKREYRSDGRGTFMVLQGDSELETQWGDGEPYVLKILEDLTKRDKMRTTESKTSTEETPPSPSSPSNEP